MHTSAYDSFQDLPENCRAAADRMENALKAEENGNYCIARISADCGRRIDELEKELGNSCGKNIVLVAYQENS